MVSSVSDVRLWSTQTALRIMKQTDQEQAAGTGSGSLASRLLSDYGIDDNDDGVESGTYGLLSTIAEQQDSAAADNSALQQPDSITSKDFFTFLKRQLEEMKNEPGKVGQAEAMLKALDAGTLTVSDAAEGKSIRVTDPEKASTQETKSTELTSKDWGTFLRDHLTRENGGIFARNADGSYVDRQNGEHAFYGSLGEKSYYLTWPSTTAK